MAQAYWSSKGKYQAVYDVLQTLIPIEGECPKNQPALDKLRRAANCYYDLYNNGLCNRAREFRMVFGFGGTVIAERHFNHPMLEDKLDAMVDKFVLAAAIESVNLGLVDLVDLTIATPKKVEMLTAV